MSGGLDSTAVASLAANMQKPQQLTTISYIFDELPDSDEKKYINALKEHWNTRSIQIVCDDCWPFQYPQNWAHNPSQPRTNPYWLMDSRVYERAQAEGIRTLMTGMFGDHLYSARRDWLADLVIDGRLTDAFQGLVNCIRLAGWRRTWQAHYIQRILIRIFNLLGIKRWSHAENTPDWLTPHSSALLKSKPELSDQQHSLTGEMTAQLCSREQTTASCYAVELRHPYRDRRLIEFMLALPAHQLHRCGSSKHILRMALKSKMPELVRLRQEATSFRPLFARGQEREKKVVENWLREPSAAWKKFVRPDWTLGSLDILPTPEKDGPHALVIWRCLSYEAWHRSFVA
jgi:asparagine synthase (glutamine-hydrolysing)